MTSLRPRPRSRTLIPLIVIALGIALGTGGLALLWPLRSGGTEQLADTANGHPASQRPLSGVAIRDRIEPSVVDVTATLAYDDETASGTGFVVDARTGFILTNNHVIRDATSVTVTVPATGRTYQASIVGIDLTADIAILSISPSAGLPGAPLGNSATVTAGTPVLSFGNQAGAGGAPAVAPGVIAGTGRTIQADDGAAGFTETLHGMMATTARIEPGDSGGPLVSPTGTVIGVDTAAGTDGSTVGYAIPINTALTAEREIAGRRRGQGISLGVDGFLGVIAGTTSTRPAAAASAACVRTQAQATIPARIAPAPAGAIVDGVLCGTGAAAAGIAGGDVITAVDGRRVDSPGALTAVVSGFPPGSVVQVTWVDESGATLTARVRLGPAPAV